jgi:hypothetical protein
VGIKQHNWRVALSLLAGAVLLHCHPALAAPPAGPDEIDLTVNVPTLMNVDYTGDDQLETEIDNHDLDDGYKIVYNAGNLNWYSNRNWVIRVKRSGWEWKKNHGHGHHWDDKDEDESPILFVKKDAPGSQYWKLVSTSHSGWLSGASGGTGTFNGVDWGLLLTGPGWYDEPKKGYWRTTVTFTIVAGS